MILILFPLILPEYIPCKPYDDFLPHVSIVELLIIIWEFFPYENIEFEQITFNINLLFIISNDEFDCTNIIEL